MSQAGPSDDINAGSRGSQKAPTQIPASLVQPPARGLRRPPSHRDPEGDPCQDQAGAGARASTAAAGALCPAAGDGRKETAVRTLRSAEISGL